MAKLWTTPTPAPDALIFELLDVPPFIVQTLYNRGLQTAASIRQFLSAEATEPGDPFLLAGMSTAVDRIRQALAGSEYMAVYGDFDVDGVSSAALLVQALRGMGGHADVYIPHRVEEGYGLNRGAIERLAAQGVTLLISVDCGTSSVDEIVRAAELGMDVIVTDHHHVPPMLPPALAVINPHRPDSAYPFKDLAGVGVVFKLVQALAPQSGPSPASYIDLVALGTVVDVAPLQGENRAFTRQGLAAMRRAPRPGLQALMSVARVTSATVGTGTLGFMLGPRLNAAGRLDSARVSFDLLMSSSVEAAQPLAQKLEEQNLERQKLLESALAVARLEAGNQVALSPLIFIASEDYRAGIVGLVAGRLAEEFFRPAIAVERGDLLSRGSCRSVPCFHIAEALDQCADLLERHGGHAQAAGFTVLTARLPELQARLAALASAALAGKPLQPVVTVDSVIPISQATWQTLEWIKRMEPFGAGNPTPVFQSNGVRLRAPRPAGNGHLRFMISDGRSSWNAIAFRQAALAALLRDGDRVDIAYCLDENTWNGEKELQLVIRDVRKS